MIEAPARDEAAPYYFTYIDQVGPGDIRDLMDAQGHEMLTLLRGIDDARSTYKYAADKWTIREVANHLNDTERLSAFRAFWFARGFDSPLPSFDQHIAASSAAADRRSWSSHIDEFETVRAASRTLFRNLPDEAWTKQGMASGYTFTVRALAYITVGHVAHHVRILRERYLLA